MCLLFYVKNHRDFFVNQYDNYIIHVILAENAEYMYNDTK